MVVALAEDGRRQAVVLGTQQVYGARRVDKVAEVGPTHLDCHELRAKWGRGSECGKVGIGMGWDFRPALCGVLLELCVTSPDGEGERGAELVSGAPQGPNVARRLTCHNSNPKEAFRHRLVSLSLLL